METLHNVAASREPAAYPAELPDQKEKKDRFLSEIFVE